MHHKPAWHVKINPLYDEVAAISDEFLGQLVSELDNEDVIAIILKGSAARGEETVYSDIDLGVFVRDGGDSAWTPGLNNHFILYR